MSREPALEVGECPLTRQLLTRLRKLRMLRKWPPFGRPKAAKVTHPPMRPLNCESDPPLINPLVPPRPAARALPPVCAELLVNVPPWPRG
eukprot:4260255-Prymnesium_polylepis.1